MSWFCLVLPLALLACREPHAPASHLGNVERGRELVRGYGCQTCHTIPDVPGANATVGPPLDRFAHRVYAGGRLNTPPLLVEFLLDPRRVRPETPMPSVGLTPDDARDIAAFLYTLR